MLRQRGSGSPSDSHEVVIVTGASRGIGLEVSRRFVALGAKVGMIARDGSALDAASRHLVGTVCCAAADVADLTALTAAISRIETELGPSTVLVNNAGHGHWSAVVDTDPDDVRRVIEVNFLGAVNAISQVLPGMLARGRGSIVNVASIAGRIGAPFEAAYSASKFALVGYTEALAVEVAGTGVTATLVHPGPTETEFFRRRGHAYQLRRPRPIPAGRVADAIVKAARQRRRERFVPAWFRPAYVAKTVVPAVYGAGTKRLYADELRALRRRLGR